MTTGPDHYRQAEQLLAGRPIAPEEREQGIEGDANWPPSRMDLLAAQVHATLALAAAAATQFVIDAPDTRIGEDWEDAMSEPRDEDDFASYAGTGAPMPQSAED